MSQLADALHHLLASLRKMPVVAWWIVWLVITAIAVMISYGWIDRAVAVFAHEHLRNTQGFVLSTKIPEPLPLLAILLMAGLGVRSLYRPLPKLGRVLFLCSLSLIVARAVKDQVKFAFGRTWPETWTNGNPSFIQDGIFGFYPFHGGLGFESFPSGHTTAICAVISVLWICYPGYRLLYFICVACVCVGLIGASYHFISDIVAGCFLGTSVGTLAVRLMAKRARLYAGRLGDYWP